MFYSKKYIIQKDDMLIRIAEKFRLSSWRIIWDAPANAKVKHLRKVPKRIQPGDVFFIPPDPFRMIEYKINKLLEIRAKAENMFNKMISEVNGKHEGRQHFLLVTEITASVVNLGESSGLWKLVKKEMDGMKIAAKEIAKVHRELGKSFFEEQGKKSLEPFAEITGEEGLALAVGKVAFMTWQNWLSPSYWLQRIAGDSEQVYQDNLRRIQRNRANCLNNINGRIASLRNKLLSLRVKR